LKITVLGKPYTILKQATDEGNGVMGSANSARQVINIVQGYGKEQTEETLLHEVVHIVSNELALDLAEEDVRRLAVGLYSAGIKVPVKV
jgi:hypothetical protein